MDKSALKILARWQAAGLLDAATADRIRDWEGRHGPAVGSRLSRFVLGFGGLMLATGVLLFVASNWELLAPWSKVTIIVATVIGLHAGGLLARPRSDALATTLHAVGTAAFGGGLFLMAQIFNMPIEWEQGLLLWAIGAAVALWMLRDGPQLVFVALLVPAWLTLEWASHGEGLGFARIAAVPAIGWFALGAAYLLATQSERRVPAARALVPIGVIMFVQAGASLPWVQLASDHAPRAGEWAAAPSVAWVTLGWIVAVALPLVVAWWLRGRDAWPMLVLVAFAIVIVSLDTSDTPQRIVTHLLYLAASLGLVWWGLQQSHRWFVNLGVFAFAATVLSFYYSSVFDKLGRSLGLIGLGVLFLAGGWYLERTRRRLLTRMEQGRPS